MNGKGKIRYVPPKFLKELDNVKSVFEIESDARAFEKIAEFVPIGMELEKMREKFVLADLFKKKRK